MYFEWSTTNKDFLIGVQEFKRFLDARMSEYGRQNFGGQMCFSNSLIAFLPTHTNSFDLSFMYYIEIKFKGKGIKIKKTQFARHEIKMKEN